MRISTGGQVVKRHKKEDRFSEFLAEAEDILNYMSVEVLKFGKGVKAGIIDPAILNNIFRSAHTLKGISGIVEFRAITELSHAVEDKLDLLRLGRIALTHELLDSITAVHGLLVKIVNAKGNGDFSQEVKEMKALLDKSSEAKKNEDSGRIKKEILSALTEYEGHRLRENLKEGKRIYMLRISFPLMSFDKEYSALAGILNGDAEIIATLPSKGPKPGMLYFKLLVGSGKDKTHLTGLLKGFSGVRVKHLGGSGAKGAFAGVARPDSLTELRRPVRTPAITHIETFRRTTNTVRVDIEKLDRIMSTVSELGILKSNVSRLVKELKADAGLSFYGIELSRLERLLDKNLDELKDSVLDIRMVPIGRLFSRFELFIDKLARENGKEIQVVTHGDDTELDKFLIEELADPIMHTIRNVIDHGIETPDVRLSLGKPAAGTLSLKAYHKGKHVIVEIKDDGAGIDTELICRKAVEKGLVDRVSVRQMSKRERLEIIFIPGFTTADVVSVTSGRGVGLDVVKNNITRQSGIIEIETVKGKGTRFIFTIPITQAIIQSLIVEDRGERYALPMNSVFEIIELKSSPMAKDGYFDMNGTKMPSVRLGDFFAAAGSPNGGPAYAIVAGLASHRLCIMVDRLVEELDVVIKPLPEILKSPGISGAADTGEKGTILVLDVAAMLDGILADREALTLSERIV